jgi:hypothetical protein
MNGRRPQSARSSKAGERTITRGQAAILSALLGGAGGALASCNWIVGVGDYAVGDAAAGDGTTGAADVGGGDDRGGGRMDAGGGGDGPREGAADVTVMDGTGVDAPRDSVGERGADASEAGEAAGGGDGEAGGGDADGGPPEASVDCGETIPTGQADFQTLVSTCAFAVSCDPYLFPISLSSCISQNALRAAPSFACLSTITSCTGTTNSYYSCEGARYATTSECPGFNSNCDTINNVAIDCNFTTISGIVTDCSRTPLAGCQIYADSGTSSNADCLVVNPCSAADGGIQCSGNNRYGCVPVDDGGVGVGRNCGTATCTASANNAVCQFNGTGTCTDAGTTACSGNTLQVCNSDGQAFNYDCTRAGGVCATDNAARSSCVAPGCSLNSTCTESCNQTTNSLTVCIGGAPFTVSCTQYGFSSCGTDTTTGYVYCLP